MVLLQNEVDLKKHSFLYFDCAGLSLVSYCRNFQDEVSLREVIDCVMPGIVGADTNGCTLDHYKNVGNMFSGCFIYYMSVDMCVCILGFGGQHNTQRCHQS